MNSNNDGVSTTPTENAVICQTDGQVFMTEEEYQKQLGRSNADWACPKCGNPASWDEVNFEKSLGAITLDS